MAAHIPLTGAGGWERTASAPSTSYSGAAASNPAWQRHRGNISRHSSHRHASSLCRSQFYDVAAWRREEDVEPMQMDAISPLATPVMSAQKAMDRLYNAVHINANKHFGAFYSSELRGIVTNPAFMVVHMDDHMVHRGHAIWETVHLSDGYLFQLPQRLKRFRKSAAAAGIDVPMSDADLMRIILDTAAASKKSNGTVKFWLSAGRGGFGLSSKECLKPTLYVLATSEICPQSLDRTRGWTACACPLPPKGLSYRSIKSNNLLEAAIAKAYAEEQGANVALFVDEEGYVLQGPTENIAMIGEDESVLITPPFDQVPAGQTLKRLMKLIPAFHRKFPTEVTVSRVVHRRIHADELLTAKEVFLLGSTYFVTPIITWHEKPIGDGEPGMICLALANVLEKDMKPPAALEGSPDLLEVPYGSMTGMRGQLV